LLEKSCCDCDGTVKCAAKISAPGLSGTTSATAKYPNPEASLAAGQHVGQGTVILEDEDWTYRNGGEQDFALAIVVDVGGPIFRREGPDWYVPGFAGTEMGKPGANQGVWYGQTLGDRLATRQRREQAGAKERVQNPANNTQLHGHRFSHGVTVEPESAAA
jgi:hypothetical protein